ncbi:hypothetical protein SAMN05216323_102249 [Williamwhitmania taraxaci]|uniref:Uncharacterized protein n=1 Tax=Williamwhitmania taraxaci TaxID=1640674 RepID=A0A1G6K386_9BACT|nr:hypothetical protein SAMN05216323_102249 [Williamwhitmania taraxaci]
MPEASHVYRKIMYVAMRPQLGSKVRGFGCFYKHETPPGFTVNPKAFTTDGVTFLPREESPRQVTHNKE